VFGIETTVDPVAIHRRVGYLPGEFDLYGRLTGSDTIAYFANLRGGVDRGYVDTLVQRLDLDPSRRFREYSKGNKQKVGLIVALQHRPDLLILDEPTSGLDPLMEAVFQQTIRELTAEGRTVLLSSHILAEVEALCDTVSIIRTGRTVQSGTLAELRQLRRTTIIAETHGPVVGLDDIVGVRVVEVEGGHVHLEVEAESLDHAVRHLSDAGLVSLVSTPPTLEQLFLQHYDDELAADMGHGGNGPQS
jgi:polyether ionophore transport system ATP-binding protein